MSFTGISAAFALSVSPNVVMTESIIRFSVPVSLLLQDKDRVFLSEYRYKPWKSIKIRHISTGYRHFLVKVIVFIGEAVTGNFCIFVPYGRQLFREKGTGDTGGKAQGSEAASVAGITPEEKPQLPRI